MKDQDHAQKASPEAAHPTEGARSEKGNGVREKFTEPQSWALKWDGFALFGFEEQQNERAPAPNIRPR